MTPRSGLAVALCLAAGLSVAQAESAGDGVLDVGKLLDTYAAGGFDEAVRTVEQAGDTDAQLLRQQWRTGGRSWINADPAEKSRRLLAAAAFSLETEHLRMERGGWSAMLPRVCPATQKEPMVPSPAGPCVLEWGIELLRERGVADAGERAWYLAASALAGGVRDWRFLYRMSGLEKPIARGLVAEGLLRFPDDPALRLERAMVLAARWSVTTDGPAAFGTVVIRGSESPPARNRPDDRETAIAAFRELAADPGVGAEARLRLGYLYWAIGDVDRGRSELEAAAQAAKDPDLRYLAHFLRGWTALMAKRPSDAVADLEAALQARPHSQSAALALAAIELLRGEAARAYELTRTSLEARPLDADPWRGFLYGHYSRLPAAIADMRAQVRQ